MERWTRRKFLKAGGVALGSALLAACDPIPIPEFLLDDRPLCVTKLSNSRIVSGRKYAPEDVITWVDLTVDCVGDEARASYLFTLQTHSVHPSPPEEVIAEWDEVAEGDGRDPLTRFIWTSLPKRNDNCASHTLRHMGLGIPERHELIIGLCPQDFLPGHTPFLLDLLTGYPPDSNGGPYPGLGKLVEAFSPEQFEANPGRVLKRQGDIVFFTLLEADGRPDVHVASVIRDPTDHFFPYRRKLLHKLGVSGPEGYCDPKALDYYYSTVGKEITGVYVIRPESKIIPYGGSGWEQ